MLSTTILAAANADPSPALSIVQWLLVPGGLLLVIAPNIVQWLTDRLQTRAPRARVAAIQTAAETLALLEKGTETYRAVEAQMRSEARALAESERPVEEQVAPSQPARADEVDMEVRRTDITSFRRNRRAAWLTGIGGAIGTVVLVLGFIEAASTGEPSTTAIVGSIIFVVGFASSTMFWATAQAIRDVDLGGRNGWLRR